MSSITLPDDVRSYVDQVRSRLAHLPDDDRAELLDDLEHHLTEVAAESDLPLVRVLGDPATFTADLLTSAGLAPESPADAPTARRPLRQRLVTVAPVRAVRAHPAWKQTVAFLPDLRPGWWVARGAAAVCVPAFIQGVRSDLSTFPVPKLLGSALVGLMALAVAIPFSVWLGRRAKASPGARRLDLAASILVAAGVLLTIAGLRAEAGPVYAHSYYSPSPGAVSTPSGNSLHDGEGRPITNIHAYDREGRPIEGVLLYDQTGRPLDDVSPIDEGGDQIETTYTRDGGGAPITNLFPLEQRAPVDEPGDTFTPIEPERRSFEPVRPPQVVIPRATTTAPPAGGG